MPFIEEAMPEEAQKKYGVSSAFDWVIDRERDIALVWMSRNRHHACFGKFIWKGESMACGGGKDVIQYPENIKEVYIEWTDIYVDIPPHLQGDAKAIIEAYYDAVLAYENLYYQRDIKRRLGLKLKNISVELSQRMLALKGI